MQRAQTMGGMLLFFASDGLVGQDTMMQLSSGAWRGAAHAADMYSNHYAAGDLNNDELNHGIGSLAAMVLVGVPLAIVSDGVIGQLGALAEGGGGR